jgi:hypothetical protein
MSTKLRHPEQYMQSDNAQNIMKQADEYYRTSYFKQETNFWPCGNLKKGR